MKIRISRLQTALTLSGLALLGSTLAVSPARAQDPGVSDKPITLNLNNVPIKTALELLFRSAGVRNFTIANDVQGFASIQAQDQPFSSALSNLLRSVNSTFSLDNGSYNITVKRPTPPPAAIIDKPTTIAGTGSAGGTDTTAGKAYFPYRVRKFDAYTLANLIGALGIISVPSNVTKDMGLGGGQGGAGGGRPGGFGGQQGGFGGQQGGFGGQQGGFGQQGGGGRYGGGGGGYGGGGFGGGGFGGGGFGGGFGR